MYRLALFLLSVTTLYSNPDSSSYVIDFTSRGRTFDGVGGLSGGGATSRLLWDYQEPYKTQILDYLFSPQFGASSHILKVEIGGDTFSGCGTEPSHQHNATDQDYHRGYEWWLIGEALKRNPDIVLYGLPWGFPAWIHPLKANMIMYIADYIQGARDTYGFHFHWVGTWNEESWTTEYVKTLRVELDKRGLAYCQIVVGDQGGFSWNLVAKAIETDHQFAEAVGAIGIHYPGSSHSTSEAVATGKPLWASEDDSTYDSVVGSGCLARIFNWNYVVGNMTSTIVWNLITSYLEYLRWYGDSLMFAAQPWSGHYNTSDTIWVMAHTTQFTSPGWKYLEHGRGAGILGTKQGDGGGTYVTLINPMNPLEFSLIIETMRWNHSLCIRSNPSNFWIIPDVQNATFTLSGGSIPTNLHVWRTVLFGGQKSNFVQLKDISVSSEGTFSVELLADSVYTITTTTGQQKGSHPTPPPPKNFPSVWKDDFQQYPIGRMPYYWSDQCGSWEVRNGDGSQKVLQQIVRSSPSRHGSGWHDQDSVQPITVIGDAGAVYQDLNVSTSVKILEWTQQVGVTTSACVAVRVGGPLKKSSSCEPSCVTAYNTKWYNYGIYACVVLLEATSKETARPTYFDDSPVGRAVNGTTPPPANYNSYVWVLNNLKKVYDKVTPTPIKLHEWTNLKVRVHDGCAVTFWINEEAVWSGNIDNCYPTGFTALGSGWHYSQWNNVSIVGV